MAIEEIASHSLELLLTYEQLRASTLGDFLGIIGHLADEVSERYSHEERIQTGRLPSLIIETANTGNSIKFKLGEGWLPQVSSDGENDIVISAPKKLAIPLLIGYLILWGAKSYFEIRKDALECDMKAVDIQLKQAELQLKQAEVRKVVDGDRGMRSDLTKKADQAIQKLMDDKDIHSLKLYGIQFSPKHREGGDKAK